MADFSIDELNATQAGTATSDTLKNVANDARNAACGFFKAYPSVVIPNPAFDFLDSMWDGLCSQSAPGLPPAPQPPFSGGQCEHTYRITYGYQPYNRRDDSPYGAYQTGTYDIGGPISYIGYSPVIPGNSVALIAINHPPPGNETSHTISANGDWASQYGGPLTISVEDLTGSDTCGNLPPQYPIPPIPPIPTIPGGNTYTLPTTNITYNNGNTYSVIPTLNLNASFNPTIQIGGINVSVGGGGLTVGGGSGGGSGSIDLTNLLNKIAANLGDGTTGGGGVGAVAAAAAKNTAPTPPPGGAGTVPPVPQPPTTPTVKNKAQISSVQIFLTTLPNLRQTMFATDSVYNNYAAGWFEWLQGDLVVGNRLVIQSQNTTYFAPKGADGYTFTLTNGAAGYSQVSELSS
jgi:hypothetical protein